MLSFGTGVCTSPLLQPPISDPAVGEGMTVHLFRECEAEIRGASSEIAGSKAILNFKVVYGPDVVELEITSESDLFFNYFHRVTREDYNAIYNAQRLKVDFGSYHLTLSKMIVSCIESASFSILLFLNGGEGVLRFVQNADYKFIELLECSLQRSNEFRIVKNITYRYNVLKDRLNHFGHHLEEIRAVLKTKDPESVRHRLFN
ncbi:hypothetical protein BaOVIS_022250 [Babesia ovis]|uniref:Spindle assembly abnormal protein 6 N-terminal domain-containing protein n=1 Tax=Babesia ovis TaxID=5869 RepID=A0A9W5WVC9_BABOV|nr:hypothetical protein BaOVIS_022250 [Babesia ovis]